MSPRASVREHVAELAAALPEELHHRALVLLLDVDGQLLEGLAELAVDGALDHLRA